MVKVGRIVQLDSLRGLAAVVVVFTHLRNVFHEGHPAFYLTPFFAGGAAVTLFFVLSGYVLAIPYWSGRQLPYGRYLVRRVCRIYLPYCVAVGVALAVGYKLLYSHLPFTPWFYLTWQTAFSPGLIARQLLTMSTTPAINTALWSLRYEMEMSILFPVLIFALRALPTWGGVVLAVVLQYAGIFGDRALRGNEAMVTLTWAAAFMLGALMAREQEGLGWLYGRLGSWKYPLLLLVIVGFFSGRSYTIEAACGVILYAEHSRASGWLGRALPEYLGKISYSLYLLHGTVLFAAFILLYGKMPNWAIASLYLVVAFGVADLFHRWVEVPSMTLGRRLTAIPSRQQTSLGPPMVAG